MDQELEYAIRNRAYELWELAGRPPGQHLSFWLLAEKEHRDGRLEEELQEGLEETFPASDAPSATRRTSREER